MPLLSDSQYFVQGTARETLQHRREGNNGDLWEAWEKLLKNSQRQVTPQKVKAHAEKLALTGGMDDLEYVANSIADAAADAFAEKITNPLHAQEVEKYAAFAYLVCMRLAVLEKEARDMRPKTAWVPREAPPLPPELDAKEHADVLMQKAAWQGHQLQPRGKFLFCLKI